MTKDFCGEGISSENFDLDSLYTPLSEVREESKKRWEDKALKKKVDNFLRGDIPSIFKKSPKAVFARHVATPNLEHINFIKKASILDLEPIFLEYTKDQFSPDNTTKYYLGKAFFVSGKGKNGGARSKCKKVINFNNSSGKDINKVKIEKTFLSMVEFHHMLLDSKFPSLKRFDISDWYKKKGGRSSHYYKFLLALFIRNGILFENFLLNREEKKFTQEIIIPCFREVEKIFGLKPLIVKLLPSNSEEDICWYWYPSYFEKDFEIILNKYKK